MKRTKLLYATLGLTLLFTLVQYFALNFYFYWSYWWFDVLMHFFAGVTGGLAAYWVLFSSGTFFRKKHSFRFTLLLVLLCVMTAGVAWEVLEYLYGIIDSHEVYQLDVMNDLILDAAGTMLAVILVHKWQR